MRLELTLGRLNLIPATLFQSLSVSKPFLVAVSKSFFLMLAPDQLVAVAHLKKRIKPRGSNIPISLRTEILNL